MGRPTKYNDEMPVKLMEYFESFSTFTIMGKEYPEIKTKEGFCSKVEIATSTFDLWCQKYDDFMGAWRNAKTCQANQIINLTANRIISEGYGKLLTVNVTDYKDKVDHTVEQKTIQINIDKDDDKL